MSAEFMKYLKKVYDQKELNRLVVDEVCSALITHE